MMTIEEKINKTISKYGVEDCWIERDVIKWLWDYNHNMMPHSILLLLSEDTRSIASSLESCFYEIDLLIRNSDDVECLTSKSEYIRECKKYFIKYNVKI